MKYIKIKIGNVNNINEIDKNKSKIRLNKCSFFFGLNNAVIMIKQKHVELNFLLNFVFLVCYLIIK